MASRSKTKITVDRAKALRFISKQEFYKMETKTKNRANVRVLERNWYQNSTDNESYAQQICTFAVKRHLTLIEKAIESANNTEHQNKIQLVATRDHIKQKTQICINNKMLQFYQFVGLQTNTPFMYMSQQPFIVQGALPINPNMHAMAAMQQRRYPHAANPYTQIQQMQMNAMNIKGMIQKHPASKRGNAIKKLEKSKEEIQNEKIKRLQLPQNLINCNKLTQWLDDKLNTLKEYEALIMKLCTNSKQLEHKKGAIKNLRRDADILKSTVLQQKNSNELAENNDLKKIYLDIIKMDKELPTLRKQNIKPLIDKCVRDFESCKVKQSIDTMNDIKRILSENEFDESAKQFCNIHNKQLVSCELFESEINMVLNDDLELLKDFGVKYHIQCIEDTTIFNLKIVFDGCFGDEIDNERIPPSLVILLNESQYDHYYALLPSENRNAYHMFMEIAFILKEKQGIERDKEEIDEEHTDISKFTPDHIKWIEEYKMNTLKSNGPFVSIVNVYNFYVDAMKILIEKIEDE